MSANPLSPADRLFWMFHGPLTPQVTALISFLDGPLDVEALRQAVSTAVARYPRMRCRVDTTQGIRVIEMPAIDPGEHVHSAPPAGDGLLHAISECFSAPLPDGKPLWQIVLLSNRVRGGNPETVIVWRIHHMVADGFTGMAFARDVLLRAGVAGETPLLVTKSPPKRAHSGSSGLRLVRNLASWSRLRRGGSVLNGDNSPRRVLTLVELERPMYRTVMRKFSVTLHEAVAAALATALLRHHEHHRARLEDLVLAVPHMEGRPSRSGVQGNFFGTRFIRLPLTIPDPANRLRSIAAELRRAERDRIEDMLDLFARMFHYLPGPVQQQHLWDFAQRSNTVCTVLPGNFFGSTWSGVGIRAQHVAAALPLGHGAAFTFLTTPGTIHGTIVSDPGIVPDPERIAEFLKEGLAGLV